MPTGSSLDVSVASRDASPSLVSQCTPRVRSRRRAPALVFSVLAAGLALAAPERVASAHFRMIQPASWVVEGPAGDPQKAPPCGGTSVTETGDVTTFRAGEEITVQWKETVGHAGHFRISLARDRADLIDPVVETSNGDGVSGLSISAETMAEVAYPVLADNLFPRASVAGPAADPFTTTVKLPDETCESCTLQVIQFMAQHGPGYFYHHCANVRIVAADAELPAASPTTAAPSVDADDGGCSVSSRNPARISRAIMSVLTLLGIASLWRRRRYRRR